MKGPHEAVKESLSALLDDEHSELDLRRVLKAAQQDDEVAATWQRYTSIRQAMQKQELYADVSLLDGVREALEHEQAPVLEQQGPAWQRWTGKAAVAASVTFAFLFGASYWQGSEEAGTAAVAANQSPAANSTAVVPTGFELPALHARTVSADAYGSEVPANYVQMQSRAALNQELLQNPELRAQLQRLMLKQAQLEAARQEAQR
ncbi:sigma-E factor negative regulatory protein [Agaribacterium haliotis]|uniref:sigma-E factor negative regulatory protein n=1 Tax=Agaribacterium haliotis TaxID=2013869 RepID=UPI000BB54306|nr:sigma-E factor negative regulatory protein [Agaribacterium haliotis]